MKYVNLLLCTGKYPTMFNSTCITPDNGLESSRVNTGGAVHGE
jgi:hypothetical protein